MKKIILTIVALLILIATAFWGKKYYNDRYVVCDDYYTQVPVDEVNTDSWLVDADGVKQQKGKEYVLIGYDEQGKKQEVVFTQKGEAKDYYTPGTYIKVSMSQTLTVGVKVVAETDIPQAALKKIKTNGTRK